VSEAGASVTWEVPPVPAPCKLTVCGLPPPLSLIDSVAEKLPFDGGVKVTLIVQVPLGATLVPQVFVSLKLLPLVGMMLIDVMLSELDFEPLVSVTVIGELVVPTVTFPKFNEVVDSFTTVPTPVSETV